MMAAVTTSPEALLSSYMTLYALYVFVPKTFIETSIKAKIPATTPGFSNQLI